MKTNILEAINSLIDNDLYSIDRYKTLSYKIRINNLGEALENLVKDALCNNFNLEMDKRIEFQSEYFSYLGNQNNPPDLIIRGGDAFEVKKIETKFNSFDINSRNELSKKCNIKEVQIQNPNNPANLLEAVLIEYEFSNKPSPHKSQNYLGNLLTPIDNDNFIKLYHCFIVILIVVAIFVSEYN